MVSELAGEGAPQLPTPASHVELRYRRRDEQIRRGVIPAKTVVNPLFAVFNHSLRSRSVRSSAELVIQLFDLVSLSKVLVISLFTVFIRSRSAEILSAELVAVVSSPQRRTRKKKQLLTQIHDFASEKSQEKRRISNLKNRIAVFNRSRVLVNAVFAIFDRDFGSRSVEFVNQPSVIDSACVGRSLAIQNSAMVCRLPSVNLFFACVNRSRRGEQPVLDSDFACVDCNRASAEQQIEAEPIKEEPENPPGKSTKSKKVKAGLSQYAIQKLVEEKQKTLKNAKKKLNSKFAEFVEGAALHESPKDAADFSLIPEAVDDYQFGDSNEKFVFPFLPSSDKGISSTYQCQNSEAKIHVETEMVIKHLRQVRNQVMNSTDVDLQSKRLMDAVIDVSAEVLWFTRKEEMLRLPMLKKCLLFLLWILAVFFDSLMELMEFFFFWSHEDCFCCQANNASKTSFLVNQLEMDLSMYSAYQELSYAFEEKLFNCFTIGQHGAHGKGILRESKLKDLLNGSEYVLTGDKDGDWMLIVLVSFTFMLSWAYKDLHAQLTGGCWRMKGGEGH